jgi:hypothetical protein
MEEHAVVVAMLQTSGAELSVNATFTPSWQQTLAHSDEISDFSSGPPPV